MLVWCAYCQKFVGESPPYEELALTHGICVSCEANEEQMTDAFFEKAKVLADIVARLFEAGRAGHLEEAEHIVQEAFTAGIRPVDILIGMLAPLMFVIGESWVKGTVTVKQERHFTAFCEGLYALVVAKTAAASTRVIAPADTTVLIMNAPGNEHTLGIRFMALWLADKVTKTRIVDPPPGLDELAALVASTQAKFLLISMAVAEQEPPVSAIIKRLAMLPEPNRPTIIVGGNAVKMGFVPALEGATLMADISLLPDDLFSGHT